MDIYKGFYNSPIGYIYIKSTNYEITNLDFINEKLVYLENTNYIINQCIIQLDEYFNGTRKNFDIKLAINGTEFRKNVWNELLKIPYGTTKTYKDIALSIGNPKAVRAVGGANHNNKIPIIIPCHRVIGTNGILVGYGGELWRKKWLLEHELKNL